MNWMTSAKKRMKKSRRSVEETMRVNNPHAKRKKEEVISAPAPEIHYSLQHEPLDPKSMSKDEIMITNFMRSKEAKPPPHIVQVSKATHLAKLDMRSSLDKLDDSPLASPKLPARTSSVRLQFDNKEEEVKYAHDENDDTNNTSEPKTVSRDPILFFNEGVSCKVSQPILSQHSEDSPSPIVNLLPIEDDEPLDLSSFLVRPKDRAAKKIKMPLKDTSINYYDEESVVDMEESSKDLIGDYYSLANELTLFKPASKK